MQLTHQEVVAILSAFKFAWEQGGIRSPEVGATVEGLKAKLTPLLNAEKVSEKAEKK